MLKLVLIIWLLCLIATSQDCCASMSCPQTSYCICTPVPSCASQINDAVQKFTIGQEMSYFYYAPLFEKYSVLQVKFCGENIQANNTLQQAIESSTGGFPIKNNSYEFQATADCAALLMTQVVFSRKQNGQLSNLLIALNVSGNSTEQMQIVANGLQEFGSLLFSVLISAISIFVIVVGLTIAFYARRRWMVTHGSTYKPHTLQHFQKYMPERRIEELGLEPNQCCSICLQEITQGSKIRKTPCDHIYHVICIDDWCKKSLSCPVCRVSLEQEEFQNKRTGQPMANAISRLMQMSNINRTLVQQAN